MNNRTMTESRLRGREYLPFLAITLLLLIPLYRPYLIDIHRIGVVYAIFAAVGVSMILISARAYSRGIRSIDLATHAFMLVYMCFSLVTPIEIQWDKLGLLGFLLVAYIAGRWAFTRGCLGRMMLVIAGCFVVVSVYLNYQLSINRFSYHLYYRYSSAVLKIGYLDYALFGVIAFLVFLESRIPLKYKIPLCAYVFVSVSITGARYSILFLPLALLIKILLSPKSRRRSEGLLITVVLFAGLSIYFYMTGDPNEDTNVFSYSSHRITNLFSSDASIQGRLSAFETAASAISERPLFGYGLGQSSEALKLNYPHNIVLEAGVEAGIIPATILAGVLFSSGILAIFAIRNGNSVVGLTTIYLAGAYLKSFSIYESRILFFFIGACAVASMRQRHVRRETSPGLHRNVAGRGPVV